MLESLLVCRVVIDNKETLLANVLDQSPNLAAMVSTRIQSQIQHRRGSRGNDIPCQAADITTAKAIDVERGHVDQLQQTPAIALRAGKAQLLLQLFVVLRSFAN